MSKSGSIAYGVQKTENALYPCPFRPALLKHLRENAVQKEITLDYINAHLDHVHALINVGKQQNLSTIMQLLKGESAFWINKEKVLPYHFSWQDDYFGVSISHSHVDRVRKYIKNQDNHHKKLSWEEEVELFIKNYGFERIKG